jgi:hypothetical protein
MLDDDATLGRGDASFGSLVDRHTTTLVRRLTLPSEGAREQLTSHRQHVSSHRRHATRRWQRWNATRRQRWHSTRRQRWHSTLGSLIEWHSACDCLDSAQHGRSREWQMQHTHEQQQPERDATWHHATWHHAAWHHAACAERRWISSFVACLNTARSHVGL